MGMGGINHESTLLAGRRYRSDKFPPSSFWSHPLQRAIQRGVR
jgi:hypothetical protein